MRFPFHKSMLPIPGHLLVPRVRKMFPGIFSLSQSHAGPWTRFTVFSIKGCRWTFLPAHCIQILRWSALSGSHDLNWVHSHLPACTLLCSSWPLLLPGNIHPLHYSSSVSYTTMALWFQWDNSPATACRPPPTSSSFSPLRCASEYLGMLLNISNIRCS